jgi:hypothetical protein
MRSEVLFDAEAALLYEAFDLELSVRSKQVMKQAITESASCIASGTTAQHKRSCHLPAGNHRHGANDESGAGCIFFWHLGKNEAECHNRFT